MFAPDSPETDVGTARRVERLEEVERAHAMRQADATDVDDFARSFGQGGRPGETRQVHKMHATNAVDRAVDAAAKAVADMTVAPHEDSAATAEGLMIKALWDSLFDAPDTRMSFYQNVVANETINVAVFRHVELDGVTRRVLWASSSVPPPDTSFEVSAVMLKGKTTIQIASAYGYGEWRAFAHDLDIVVRPKV